MSRLWLKLTGKNTKDGKIYVCTNQECSYRRRKDPKVSNHVAHNAIKMVIIEGKMVVLSNVNSVRLLKKFPIKRTKTKMTKHEERRLMKKYSQPDEPEVL